MPALRGGRDNQRGIKTLVENLEVLKYDDY